MFGEPPTTNSVAIPDENILIAISIKEPEQFRAITKKVNFCGNAVKLE